MFPHSGDSWSVDKLLKLSDRAGRSFLYSPFIGLTLYAILSF